MLINSFIRLVRFDGNEFCTYYKLLWFEEAVVEFLIKCAVYLTGMCIGFGFGFSGNEKSLHSRRGEAKAVDEKTIVSKAPDLWMALR